jgi:hypothetical protein
MKHCTNCGELIVDTAKFCQKCSTKVLPPISLIPLAERDNDEDDLIYKGSFKKKKKMKRDLAVNDKKIPSIIHSSSSLSRIGSNFSIGFSTSFSGCVIPSSSTAALEVKNKRAKATLEDRVTTKEMKLRYRVDLKYVEKWVVEI